MASKFVLVEVKDDGTVSATVLSDPVTVQESDAISIPLSALIPPPPPPPAGNPPTTPA
jgi:hypothetical protein